MNTQRLTPLLCLALASCAARPAGYEDRRSEWAQTREELAEEPARQSVELGETAGLPQLLAYARANNPGLRAAFENWKVALEQIPQVTALPAPQLSFGAYLSEVETRVGPMQGRIGFRQPFPWFGKLELAGKVAFEASEAVREQMEAARLGLDERIRITWCEYAWIQQAILITDGNLDLLLHWESVARNRFASGLGTHSDVIRAQVELGKLEDRLLTLQDLRRPVIAALNAALNREPHASLPEPSFPLPEPAAFDEQVLAEGLHASSPRLRALQHMVQAARHGIDLADKAFYPNFVLGADYTFIGSAVNGGTAGSGDDAIALTFGFELPVWRESYHAGERQAQARARGARLSQEEALNRLSSELEMAFYRFRDADRRVALFRDSLIPKGEQSIQASDTAYQAGNKGFLDLIDAQRALLEFQLQVARATTDRAKALASIERITGKQLHKER